MSEIYNLTGRIHSIQSLAASDGPGVRFAVFLQGCPLRCGCCHNPDTWNPDGGKVISAGEIVEKATRYRTYFGSAGGVTVSGGEPLLQAEFVKDLFSKCKSEGINTCLDTSGSVMSEAVKKLLSKTDRVLLDIKYTNDTDYKENAGCGYSGVLDFLEYLNEKNIPTTLRQVIIPSLNDSDENILELKNIREKYRCVDKVELLPFRKICTVKYENMGKEFPLAHIPEPAKDKMEHLRELLGGQEK